MPRRTHVPDYRPSAPPPDNKPSAPPPDFDFDLDFGFALNDGSQGHSNPNLPHYYRQANGNPGPRSKSDDPSHTNYYDLKPSQLSGSSSTCTSGSASSSATPQGSNAHLNAPLPTTVARVLTLEQADNERASADLVLDDYYTRLRSVLQRLSELDFQLSSHSSSALRAGTVARIHMCERELRELLQSVVRTYEGLFEAMLWDCRQNWTSGMHSWGEGIKLSFEQLRHAIKQGMSVPFVPTRYGPREEQGWMEDSARLRQAIEKQFEMSHVLYKGMLDRRGRIERMLDGTQNSPKVRGDVDTQMSVLKSMFDRFLTRLKDHVKEGMQKVLATEYTTLRNELLRHVRDEGNLSSNDLAVSISVNSTADVTLEGVVNARVRSLRAAIGRMRKVNIHPVLQGVRQLYLANAATIIDRNQRNVRLLREAWAIRERTRSSLAEAHEKERGADEERQKKRDAEKEKGREKEEAWQLIKNIKADFSPITEPEMADIDIADAPAFEDEFP